MILVGATPEKYREFCEGGNECESARPSLVFFFPQSSSWRTYLLDLLDGGEDLSGDGENGGGEESVSGEGKKKKSVD